MIWILHWLGLPSNSSMFDDEEEEDDDDEDDDEDEDEDEDEDKDDDNDKMLKLKGLDVMTPSGPAMRTSRSNGLQFC